MFPAYFAAFSDAATNSPTAVLRAHRPLRCMTLASAFVCILAIGVIAPTVTVAHDDPNAPGHQHGDHDPSDHDHSAEHVMTTRPDALVLPPPPEGDDVFHFVIYGDRTGGPPEGVQVLAQAVEDTNLLDPDLVMTVGDLVQGYNTSKEWLPQMTEFKDIANRLNMEWYPVAGNHDVYWRGQGETPAGQNEALYEKHFGPLWYSFQHKNAGFIVLYSDEGDRETHKKGFRSADLQNMSDEQFAFLDQALKELKDAEHVFVFLHHPRWVGQRYEGSNWPKVHKKLVAAGNVSAVFAGHIHRMRYDGEQDGIEYYALATTGGGLQANIPDAGYLHHLNMVTVRRDRISVAAIPVGAVIDPKQFTPEFLAQVDAARRIRPVQSSPELLLHADGACSGEVTMEIKNPGERDVDITLMNDSQTLRGGWQSSLDHSHFTLAAGDKKEFVFQFRRDPAALGSVNVPAVRMEIDVLSPTARVRLPAVTAPLKIALGQVPADYFTTEIDRCLLVKNENGAVRINSEDLKLPDGPMTLETWVRPIEIAGHHGVVAKTEQSEFAIFSDEGVPQFLIYLDGRYVAAKASDPMIADQWTHLAGVYDGDAVKLFVDGKLVAERPVRKKKVDGKETEPKQLRNEQPLYIGADPDRRGRPSRAIHGMVDEVRISKAAIYTESFSPEIRHTPTQQTVLLMHLDRAVGPFILDHSDSATSGVLGASSVLVKSPPKR